MKHQMAPNAHCVQSSDLCRAVGMSWGVVFKVKIKR